jgi:Mlc titration factor MtfA (ptsG expression regulator)
LDEGHLIKAKLISFPVPTKRKIKEGCLWSWRESLSLIPVLFKLRKNAAAKLESTSDGFFKLAWFKTY